MFRIIVEEKKLVEFGLKALRIKVSFDCAAMANGNDAGLLADHDDHGIVILTQAQAGAVAQTEIPVEIAPLAHRKNTCRRDDPAAADDHAPVVQGCLGIKNRDQQFGGQFGINRHAALRKLIEARVALDGDEGAELAIREVERGVREDLARLRDFP